MNLRRGAARLAIVLWALWLLYWTSAYVLQPNVSENAQPIAPSLSPAGIAVLAAVAAIGLWWIFVGLRSN